MVPPQQGQVLIVHPQQAPPPSLEQVRIARTISTGKGER
jgi:hypothetical protein